MTAAQRIEGKLNSELAAYLKANKMDAPQRMTYREFLEDRMLLIQSIRLGIPYSFFEWIQVYAPFSESDWADFLDISTKSLQRYKAAPHHLFKPIHSEKIIEIAEVTKVGLEVWGDIEKLKHWLHTPNYAFGNLRPMELLKDSYGKDLVLGELTRISHGILV